MPTRSARPAIVTAFALMLGMIFAQTAVAQSFKIDPMHTSVVFRISHGGISKVYGMFTEVGGSFVLDQDDTKTNFKAEIKVDSISTGQKKRDEHLKSPDFFNAPQFHTITFKSTKVTAAGDGFDVTGDLTLHGVTNPVTLHLTKGGEADFPPGTHRAGFMSELEIKRSDFKMTNMLPAVGDEVQLYISFEGIKK